MTIRGGGHPKQAMVLTPVSRLGPPPRSFAADAHDCIMVRSLWTYRIQGCGAILRARWQAPLGPLCCPTKKITGARSKSALTENAPYKACSAFTRVAACTLALPPIRDTLIEGFSHFVTSMTAPIASGWSGCRVGLAPTGKRRLVTAHTQSGTPRAAYSITSSARMSSVDGISRPRVLAVCTLTASSNLIGSSTGRSAGFAAEKYWPRNLGRGDTYRQSYET